MIQRLPNSPAITPRGNRVVVEVVRYDGIKTAGGLFIPDEAAKNNAREAIVAAFDDEVVKDLELGCKVALHKFRSQALHYGQREFRIVEATEDILGTIPQDMNASFTIDTR